MLHKRNTNPLATTPLCRDLSARELRAVAHFGTVLDFPLGRHLVFAAYPPQAVIILTGAMVSTSGTGEGILETGMSFGTITGPREGAAPETLETIADSTLFVISRREFTALRTVCPRLATRLCDSSLPPPTGNAQFSNQASGRASNRTGADVLTKVCDHLTVDR
jgi:hypothetical protein